MKFNFLYFYIEKIKKWFFAFLGFALVFEEKVIDILKLLGLQTEKTKSFLDFYIKPYWLYILIGTFFIYHIYLIYDLWNQDTELKELDDDVLPSSYNLVIRKVGQFMPEKLDSIKKEISFGYKELSCNKSCKQVVQAFLPPYRLVKDFLINSMSNKDPRLLITKDLSKLIADFNKNFNTLDDFNYRISKNDKDFILNDEMTNKLMEDLNNNINGIFGSFNQ